ncbi:unnamed protein product, partial [Ixodes persulcatus]
WPEGRSGSLAAASGLGAGGCRRHYLAATTWGRSAGKCRTQRVAVGSRGSGKARRRPPCGPTIGLGPLGRRAPPGQGSSSLLSPERRFSAWGSTTPSERHRPRERQSPSGTRPVYRRGLFFDSRNSGAIAGKVRRPQSRQQPDGIAGPAGPVPSCIRVGPAGIVVRAVVDPAEEAPFRRLLTSPAGNGDPVRLRCCCCRTAVEVNASPATLTATGVLPRSSAPTTSRANASYPRSRTAAVLASPAAHRHATHWA